MVIEMMEAQALKVLLNCIATIELCLKTKEEFLASLTLQDKVLSSLDELSVMSRTIDWGYRGTIAEAAWRSINNLVFIQLLIPGVNGIDRYETWRVASECLPIIKHEAIWASRNVSKG